MRGSAGSWRARRRSARSRDRSSPPSRQPHLSCSQSSRLRAHAGRSSAARARCEAEGSSCSLFTRPVHETQDRARWTPPRATPGPSTAGAARPSCATQYRACGSRSISTRSASARASAKPQASPQDAGVTSRHVPKSRIFTGVTPPREVELQQNLTALVSEAECSTAFARASPEARTRSRTTPAAWLAEVAQGGSEVSAQGRQGSGTAGAPGEGAIGKSSYAEEPIVTAAFAV